MNNEEQLPISSLIKKYRKLQGMTQEQLCEASGLSISTLKKYENNTRNPKPEQLEKIAEALQVSKQVFMPLKVKDISDVLITLVQMDEKIGIQWEFKKIPAFLAKYGLKTDYKVTLRYKKYEKH